MGIRLDPGSRFQTTDVVLVKVSSGETVEAFGIWRRPSFLKVKPSNDLIGKYQVPTGLQGRPDLIAAELYGSSSFDWIIIAFNNAMDVLNWPQPGAVIEYPLPSVVFSEID